MKTIMTLACLIGFNSIANAETYDCQSLDGTTHAFLTLSSVLTEHPTAKLGNEVYDATISSWDLKHFGTIEVLNLSKDGQEILHLESGIEGTTTQGWSVLNGNQETVQISCRLIPVHPTHRECPRCQE